MPRYSIQEDLFSPNFVQISPATTSKYWWMEDKTQVTQLEVKINGPITLSRTKIYYTTVLDLKIVAMYQHRPLSLQTSTNPVLSNARTILQKVCQSILTVLSLNMYIPLA
jgi:hypothetical protein